MTAACCLAAVGAPAAHAASYEGWSSSFEGVLDELRSVASFEAEERSVESDTPSSFVSMQMHVSDVIPAGLVHTFSSGQSAPGGPENWPIAFLNGDLPSASFDGHGVDVDPGFQSPVVNPIPLPGPGLMVATGLFALLGVSRRRGQQPV